MRWEFGIDDGLYIKVVVTSADTKRQAIAEFLRSGYHLSNPFRIAEVVSGR